MRLIKSFLCCFSLLILLTGCGAKYPVVEDPFPIPAAKPPEQIRVALVLGGGGVRGMSHVGVLAEFEKNHIPIDILVGCSAGSIVGALYADCPDAAAVKKILGPLKKWDILDLNFSYCRYGLVHGRSLKRFFNGNLKCKNFEDLKIPLYVVATDLIAGELITFSRGPVVPAVHASAAVPFLFAPVYYCDRMLVDGGVVNPIPVVVAKDLGAEIIIAVDLSELLPKTCPSHLFGVAARSAEIKFLAQSESCVRDADIVIKPDLGDIGMFDDVDNNELYKAGQEAAKRVMPQIKEALARIGLNVDEPCEQESEADALPASD